MFECSEVQLVRNTVIDTIGGAGGRGGHGATPGGGGAGVGVHLTDCLDCYMTENLILSCHGGSKGAGYGGSHGRGVGLSVGGLSGVVISGSTVVESTGSVHSAGVRLEDQATAHLEDSVVSGASGVCIFNDAGNQPQDFTVAHSLLADCSAGVFDNVTEVEGTCIHGQDPLFVDPAGGDYHLQSGSPAVDAGNPASAYDLEPAPNGCRVNMGAYGNSAEAASAVDAEHCEQQ